MYNEDEDVVEDSFKMHSDGDDELGDDPFDDLDDPLDPPDETGFRFDEEEEAETI